MGKNKSDTFRNFTIPHRFNYKVEEVEKSLKNLSDILFVKIVLSESEEIKEIHVITKDSSNPKRITRDIESFLLAKYNIEVDYRKISIAQVKDEEIKNSQASEESKNLARIKISDIKISTNGKHFEAIIKLENNERIFEGKASGINWDKNSEYLVAKAVLDAISNILEGSIFFQINEIKKVKLESEKKLAVVSLNLINSKGKEGLIGSTMVNGDFNEAVVKAVLKAANRRVFTKKIKN